MNIDKQRAKVDFHDTKQRIIGRLEKLPFNTSNSRLLSKIREELGMRVDMVERRLALFTIQEEVNVATTTPSS